MRISSMRIQPLASANLQRPSLGHPSVKKFENEPLQARDQVSLSFSAEPQALPRTSLLSAQQAGLQASLAAALPASLAAPIHEAFQQGFVKGYLSPSEIRQRCQALQEEFPDLIEIVETGHKTHGYRGKNAQEAGSDSLYYLRIGPKSSDRDEKLGVFQYAAPHARELMNPMTMMELTEQLVRNFNPESQNPEIQANTRLLQELDIFVAPMTNPDGARFALYDDPMWRKNRSPVEGGKVGVDINRNYPYDWRPSDKPASQTYSGSGPASEAETQAILKVVENHPNIRYVVDWHSHGQEIRRPLGISQTDSARYDELHNRVSQAIQSVAGNRYAPVISEVVYGTSDDHFYHVNGILSTVMETGTQFAPPTKQALVVMQESVAGAREFLEAAREEAK